MRIKLLVAVLVSMAFGVANATGKKQPTPPMPSQQKIEQYMAQGQAQRQAQRQAQEQAQRQRQQANATNNANTTSAAGSLSASGAVGVNDNTSQGGNVTDDSSYRAYALALPNPVNVPELSRATAVCALSESGGFGVGWNFISSSSAKQAIDGMCLAERQAVAFEQTCKFRSAAAIRYWIAREAGANQDVAQAVSTSFYNAGADIPDYTAEQRDSLRSLGAFLQSVNANPWELERDYPAEQCNGGSIIVTPAPVVVPVIKTPRG